MNTNRDNLKTIKSLSLFRRQGQMLVMIVLTEQKIFLHSFKNNLLNKLTLIFMDKKIKTNSVISLKKMK
jgi:hypothetical protein